MNYENQYCLVLFVLKELMQFLTWLLTLRLKNLF